MGIEITVLGEPPITRTLFGNISEPDLINVPGGKVIVFENHDAQNTIVLGYFKRGLLSNEIKIQDKMEVYPVPKELQNKVTKSLHKQDYHHPFTYW